MSEAGIDGRGVRKRGVQEASRSTALQAATLDEVRMPRATPLQSVKEPSGRNPPSMKLIVHVGGVRGEDGDDQLQNFRV